MGIWPNSEHSKIRMIRSVANASSFHPVQDRLAGLERSVPDRRAAAEADRLGVDLLAPQIGQLLTIDGELPRDRWWDKLAPTR